MGRDRDLYRRQLAILLDTHPAFAQAELATLSQTEQALVETEHRMRWLLAPPLLVERTADGGEVRYIGRPDGVYLLRVNAHGQRGELEPYAPWSVWNKEHPEDSTGPIGA
jgi:hypothetical protein